MSPKKHQLDDKEFESDLEEMREMYQAIPSEPVSQKVSDKILSVANNEARRRRRRSWLISLIRRPFGGRQLTAIATLAAVVAFSFLLVNEQQTVPPDLLATRGLAIGKSEADRAVFAEKVSKAFAEISEIQEIEPASNKWNSRVDQLMKSEISQLEKYKSLAIKLEAAGDSEEAEKVRDLAVKLEELFSRRNPGWFKEINKGE